MDGGRGVDYGKRVARGAHPARAGRMEVDAHLARQPCRAGVNRVDRDGLAERAARGDVARQLEPILQHGEVATVWIAEKSVVDARGSLRISGGERYAPR